MAKTKAADENVEVCEMCGSPFDSRVHRLVECTECSVIACTAGCIVDGSTCHVCLDGKD